MADIVLTTFNARYHHASFGLRYLKANLRELEDRASILEFDLDTRPADAVEKVLAQQPRIVGVASYVWNTRQTLEFARLLKAVRPEVTLLAGGPEISHETSAQSLFAVADHVLCGEADLAFAEVCRDIFGGRAVEKIVQCPLPDLEQVAMPYHLYTDEDLPHRTIYVESSRGCPFTCEFCLSSLEVPVRRFPLQAFLAEMGKLIARGCRQFKFVDRTFNVHTAHACAILKFFLAHGVGNSPCDPATNAANLFLHFEMIPDRLPKEVRQLLTEFPPGMLQLEIGVQTFDAEVAQRIGRQQDNDAVMANLQYLRQHTYAHLHVDLIAGLPGESLEGFARGFDLLVSLSPHEIQLGILKRLRGAPIARHTDDFAMVYCPDAPYEIVRNNLLDFPTLQRIKRMARYWDLYANSGNFRDSLPLLWRDGGSPFAAFMAFSDFLYAQTGKTHELALSRQFELLWSYLNTRHGGDDVAGLTLANDYRRPGRRDLPGCLERFATEARASEARVSHRRQDRHR